MKEILPIHTPEILSYSVRVAKATDAEKLVELVKNGMPGYPFESVYDAKTVGESIESGSSLRIVVEDNNKNILGTAVLGDEPEHMQEIKRVVTSPNARKQGLASEMTRILTSEAERIGVVPWVDARGDQPGMQKAAIHAGYTAVSLEQGKHCVYTHLDSNNRNIGPARETMVHLTSLPVDLDELISSLARLDKSIVMHLYDSINKALYPSKKSMNRVHEYIPDAHTVKTRIQEKLMAIDKEGIQVKDLTDDIALLETEGVSMIIVKPDASGFINDVPDTRYVKKMLSLGESIGLQTMTAYIDIDTWGHTPNILYTGLMPTMLRIWQKNKEAPITWQIGWRHTCNKYDESLHHIHLAAETREQLEKVRMAVGMATLKYNQYEPEKYWI